MSKLDEVKEILNSLRVAMSIAFGLLVVIVSGVVNRYDNGRIDEFFWMGIFLALADIGAIYLMVRKIAQKTKEIKEL